MQISRTLPIKRWRPGSGPALQIALVAITFLLLLPAVLPVGAADEWDTWGDSGEKTGEPVIKRPFISGWWNWQYNEFSSFDQGRVNFEKELGNGSKLLTGLRINYYTEDNNKKWKVFPGENYYFCKAGDLDFKAGMLIENIGSGDKFSFVDKLNSRYFHNGLANDYDRDKKEVPGVRATWYINRHFKFSGHYLPYFTASEFPTIYSKWAYAIHKSLASELLFKGGVYNAASDASFDPQFHVELSSVYPKIEMRFHYLRLKERLPVISQDKPGIFNGSYPLDETFAVNGNLTLSKELLLRYELAWSRDRTWTTYEEGHIGQKFVSDHVGMLFGTDRNLPNNFYVNVQGMVSHVPDFKATTPFQLNETEYLSSLQMRQNFRQDRLQIELNVLKNFSSGEYVLTPKIQIIKSDYLTFMLGYQMNGEGAETLGPVGQFSENNTAVFETRVTF
ncbi:MAG TPA: hypothetical protein PLM07_09610 [Candidatus Rifleibacterium sp.]|nr:hypothetical protein [Candidatus Rifleibacterium sp.]HPT46145.1 hypothetical protein [Candidatus Rifleibacterium sp.]